MNVSAAASVQPKPYVSADELAALTPWTEQAIRTMVKRHQLTEGVHYFHVGRKVVFKWATIVDFIEGRYKTPAVRMHRGACLGEPQEA